MEEVKDLRIFDAPKGINDYFKFGYYLGRKKTIKETTGVLNSFKNFFQIKPNVDICQCGNNEFKVAEERKYQCTKCFKLQYEKRVDKNV